MSRDIRSYFSVSSQKKNSGGSSIDKNKPGGKAKKKRALIESDSEEEDFVPKKKHFHKDNETKPKEQKKEAPEVKVVDVGDVFSSEPIKRKKREKTAVKPKELHDDPDFEAMLLGLDDSGWTEAKSTSAANGHDKEKANMVRENPNAVKVNSKEQSAETSFKKQKSPLKESAKKLSTHESPSKICKESSSDVQRSSPRKRNVESIMEEQNSEEIFVEKEFKEAKERKRITTPDKIENKKSKIEDDPQKASSKNEKTSPVKDMIKPSSSITCDKIENKKAKIDYSTVRDEKKSPVKSVKASPSLPPPPPPPSYMWVDKYKPTSIKQIIGQQGDSSNVKKLLQWLSAWHSNHGPGVNKKHVRPSPWAKDNTGAYFKAALLSGSPGVGKTTTAHLVCKELGFDIVEFNASDTRSKKLMKDEVSELLSSKSLLPYFQNSAGSSTTSKHVLLMDEVDGMAGNEDRGGVQELISLIKNSKCPVICMCNDRNHPKIRSLANYCFDLRFYKLRVEQIRGAMMSVCFKENVKISAAALDEVIVGTNCDVRQVLHNLSMWCSSDKKLSPDQARVDANNAKKHIKLGPWDAVRKVFSFDSHKDMSLLDKSDLFFHDYNIMPLFVQENYPIVSPHNVKKDTDILKRMAKAAISISYGDVIEKTIRSRNDAWSLLPVQAIYASVVPGDCLAGHLTGQIQFPAWLGKNSRRSKMDRLLQELQVHMRLSISGGKQAVNMGYLPYIQNALVNPLINEGAEGVPKTLQVMQDYFLTREDLDSVLELCQWPGQKDIMSKVESKVKAALTRAYNKVGVSTPYALGAAFKKGKGSSMEQDNEDYISASEESDEDNDAADAMIKTKKPEKKGNTGKTSEPSTSKGAGTSSRGRGGGGGKRGRGRGK